MTASNVMAVTKIFGLSKHVRKNAAPHTDVRTILFIRSPVSIMNKNTVKMKAPCICNFVVKCPSRLFCQLAQVHN